MRLRHLAVTGLALTFALGACAGSDSKDSKSDSTATTSNVAATMEVTVKDFVFSPDAIRVKSGATVTWTNKDDFDHSVQIDSLDFDGPKFGPVTQPATFSHQFSKPGTYKYICGVHNSMTGTVIVTS